MKRRSSKRDHIADYSKFHDLLARVQKYLLCQHRGLAVILITMLNINLKYVSLNIHASDLLLASRITTKVFDWYLIALYVSQ